MKTTLRKSVRWWFPLILIGMFNGAVRVFFLNQVFPELVAHQFSSFLMIVWIMLYLNVVYTKLGIERPLQAWTAGGIWMVLTVLFEFAFGYLIGTSMDSMLADYNLLAGRFWAAVLATLLVGPFLWFKFRKDAPITSSRNRTA